MKKVLLISPPFERFMGFSRFYYHIGLAYLAAVLEKAGHDVMIYDADHSTTGKMLNPQELMAQHGSYEQALKNDDHPIWLEAAQVIRDYRPDFVGVSVLSVMLPAAKKIIGLARSACPQAQIIAGGAHATLRPDDLVAAADYVITNEGEKAIVDIVAGRCPRGVIQGERVTELDSLPFPAIERLYGFETYEKRDLSIVMSSRGCPNSCKFCSSFDLWKCEVIHKSPEYFVSELERLISRYGIRDFFITDDSFTCNRKWLDAFLPRMKELKVTWRCFSRINAMDEDLVCRMREAGCRHIKLGIESGSQRILNMIDKKIKTEDVLRVSDLLGREHIYWSAYFIIGFPGETVEDIRMTQEMIRRISADSITVNVYTPLPNNRLKDDYGDIDYSKFSFHSPNNNFTGCIDDDKFHQLVTETLEIAQRGYNEHLVHDIER